MSQQTIFKFRLYIAGDTQNSVQALANLTALCEVRLSNHYEIEVVDVLREPKRALADAIFMTPTSSSSRRHPCRKSLALSANLVESMRFWG